MKRVLQVGICFLALAECGLSGLGGSPEVSIRVFF